MKKIVILGCENSHADQFLNFIKKKPEFSDVEVVGIYSDESAPAERLAKIFNLNVMESYDAAVGQVDGVIVTARHGDNHLKYALPYIDSGVPMFIDKPITIKEDEAVQMARLLKSAGVRVSGGSSLAKEAFVCKLAEDAASETDGKTLGGFVRAPMNSDAKYGGFYFYAQHLTEMVMKIFGRYPKSVSAKKHAEGISVTFHYDSYDINGLFVYDNYLYYAARFAEKSNLGADISLSGNSCFYDEFMEFYKLLSGEEQSLSYEDFIAPVFVMNAIDRAMESGREETVARFSI